VARDASFLGSVPDDLRQVLARHGQEHVLAFWDELREEERAVLEAEIRALDFSLLERLIGEHVGREPAGEPPPGELEPVEVERGLGENAVAAGEAALAGGEVDVVLVAGGQGTRLGFDGPKGTFGVGPVSGASLFQIHAEKVVALERRFGRAVPLFVMTSPDNDETTRAFFAEHDDFGLERVRFFVQGQLPAVDRLSGKLLLAEKGRLALSPDGHGGVVRALAARGGSGVSCLDELRAQGVGTVFYFQVDNALVRVADPGFLGVHRLRGAEMSLKVVEKTEPGERVGIVAVAGGEPRVIEYSDLAAELAKRRRPDGGLELWAGSIAIHAFELAFLERLAEGDVRLPYHRAAKKVTFVDGSGALVRPEEPNAVKFESFVFDALPLARRACIVETSRREEFAPLKNASGSDSPETVRRLIGDLHAGWLQRAGAAVHPGTPVEISPLFALDERELRGKVSPGLRVDRPLYLR
jgi:UDP-N-acetylglucosamine/UDP-N-acetylgalactosamine diphosphorylase